MHMPSIGEQSLYHFLVLEPDPLLLGYLVRHYQLFQHQHDEPAAWEAVCLKIIADFALITDPASLPIQGITAPEDTVVNDGRRYDDLMRLQAFVRGLSDFTDEADMMLANNQFDYLRLVEIFNKPYIFYDNAIEGPDRSVIVVATYLAIIKHAHPQYFERFRRYIDDSERLTGIYQNYSLYRDDEAGGVLTIFQSIFFTFRERFGLHELINQPIDAVSQKSFQAFLLPYIQEQIQESNWNKIKAFVRSIIVAERRTSDTMLCEGFFFTFLGLLEQREIVVFLRDIVDSNAKDISANGIVMLAKIHTSDDLKLQHQIQIERLLNPINCPAAEHLNNVQLCEIVYHFPDLLDAQKEIFYRQPKKSLFGRMKSKREGLLGERFALISAIQDKNPGKRRNLLLVLEKYPEARRSFVKFLQDWLWEPAYLARVYCEAGVALRDDMRNLGSEFVRKIATSNIPKFALAFYKKIHIETEAEVLCGEIVEAISNMGVTQVLGIGVEYESMQHRDMYILACVQQLSEKVTIDAPQEVIDQIVQISQFCQATLAQDVNFVFAKNIMQVFITSPVILHFLLQNSRLNLNDFIQQQSLFHHYDMSKILEKMLKSAILNVPLEQPEPVYQIYFAGMEYISDVARCELLTDDGLCGLLLEDLRLKYLMPTSLVDAYLQNEQIREMIDYNSEFYEGIHEGCRKNPNHLIDVILATQSHGLTEILTTENELLQFALVSCEDTKKQLLLYATSPEQLSFFSQIIIRNNDFSIWQLVFTYFKDSFIKALIISDAYTNSVAGDVHNRIFERLEQEHFFNDPDFRDEFAKISQKMEHITSVTASPSTTHLSGNPHGFHFNFPDKSSLSTSPPRISAQNK